MTRHDVALLVFRTVALWVASFGPILILTTVAQTGGANYVFDPSTLSVGVGLAAIAVVLWLLAPWLTRATFGAGGEPLAFSLSAQGIPPLACFVVGLLQIAGAIPEGIGWIAARAIRYQEGGLMSSATDVGRAFDDRAVVAGAAVFARLLVGVTLIVLSRRPALWAPRDDDAPDA